MTESLFYPAADSFLPFLLSKSSMHFHCVTFDTLFQNVPHIDNIDTDSTIAQSSTAHNLDEEREEPSHGAPAAAVTPGVIVADPDQQLSGNTVENPFFVNSNTSIEKPGNVRHRGKCHRQLQGNSTTTKSHGSGVGGVDTSRGLDGIGAAEAAAGPRHWILQSSGQHSGVPALSIATKPTTCLS